MVFSSEYEKVSSLYTSDVISYRLCHILHNTISNTKDVQGERSKLKLYFHEIRTWKYLPYNRYYSLIFSQNKKRKLLLNIWRILVISFFRITNSYKYFWIKKVNKKIRKGKQGEVRGSCIKCIIGMKLENNEIIPQECFRQKNIGHKSKGTEIENFE